MGIDNRNLIYQSFGASNKFWPNTSTPVGTSVLKTIAVSNPLTNPLSLGTIGLVSNEFKIQTDGCSNTTLVAPGSCEVIVAFTPQAVGAKTAELTVPQAGSTTPLLTIPLEGEGTASNPVPQPTPPPPIPHDFSKVEVGQALTHAINVSNPNSSALLVGTVTLTTAVQGEFKIDGDQCSNVNLPVGGNCQITVTFNPQLAGAKTATVVIPGTSANTISITVSLTGEGTAPLPPPSILSLNVVGQGKVVSTPEGIDCGNRCQANFDRNTQVMLTTTPEMNWRLEKWQGDCDQNGQVVMDREKQCEAVFVRIETTTTTPTTTEELFKQAQENGIFNNTEATLEWLKANKISPSDLTAEQRDALPITWELPKILEPPAALPAEPISKLDEMEELLVSINRKDVVEQAEVERLNELSDELLVVAQQAEQDFQTATQSALDQKNVEPLTNFESQIKPLKKKVTTIAMLAQNATKRLQAGEALFFKWFCRTKAMVEYQSCIASTFSSSQRYTASVFYQVHVADKGWLDLVRDGNIAGTTGEGRQIEAIIIRETGLPSSCLLKYNVHAANVGWMGWTKEI